MNPGIDPKMDFVFKKLFGSEENKDLLVDLLNAVTTPKADTTVERVLLANPFSLKEAAEDKGVILDIRATDQLGRWFNVEMQPSWFPDRLLFYWAHLHSGQLSEGEQYEKLQQTVAICFLDSKLFDDEEFHHVFRLIDQTGKILLTEHLAIHVIELPKFNLSAEELTTALHVWCYFLRKAESLDVDLLPKALDTPPIRKALKVLQAMSKNTAENDLYLSRVKFQRDQAALLKDASKTGFEQGIEKGIDQGKLIGRIQVLQELLELPQTSSEDLKALAPAALDALADQLKQQAKTRP